ncbi:MAG: biotin--[acetyl-CoA-carboxylase] ligase [Gemmataceae bacterium]
MPEPREEWHFDTRHIGRLVLVFDELESTNDTASRLEPPASIVALHQTAGRGRFGRVWRSRPGSALLLSVAFQPPAELRRPSVLTVWAAVAVAEAVQRISGLDAAIKWPNDLLVSGHKICGILIEQSAATVVGIGLNLNQTREEFDAAGLPMAASLASLSGADVELKAAAEAVLRSLDEEYQSLLADRARVEEKWRARTGLMDREVEVERSDGSRLSGTLVRLTFDDVELDTASGRVRLAPEMVEHITACPAVS